MATRETGPARPVDPLEAPGTIGIRRHEVAGLPVDACADLGAVLQSVAAHLRAAAAGGRAGKALLGTFVNPASVAVARRLPAFGADLQRFDLVLPDGIGMVLAMRHLTGQRAARISFDNTSLALPVLEMAARGGHGVALVGGAPGVARAAAAQLRGHLPQLRLLGAWDGYGDAQQTIRALLHLQPRLVICGMGAGAQEAFLLRLAGAGWRGVGFTCGGYLDQTAGGLRYYPAWVDRANLRWAYRLAREPRRLWRRYVFDYGRFALRCAADGARRLARLPAAGGRVRP